MKAFLEEYGLVIVIVIVVAMLIGVAVYVSGEGKKKMTSTFDRFTATGDKALNDSELSDSTTTKHTFKDTDGDGKCDETNCDKEKGDTTVHS